MSFQFGDISVASKDFHSKYQVTDIFSIDLGKIVISEGIHCNKHDMRYIIGYKEEPNKVIPLFIKTPKNCWSSAVSVDTMITHRGRWALMSAKTRHGSISIR